MNYDNTINILIEKNTNILQDYRLEVYQDDEEIRFLAKNKYHKLGFTYNKLITNMDIEEAFTDYVVTKIKMLYRKAWWRRNAKDRVTNEENMKDKSNALKVVIK